MESPFFADSSQTGVAFRELTRRVLAGPLPKGDEFAACRALLELEHDGPAAFQALCMLLEGALADPQLPIDDTQTLVPLLKALARGAVAPGDLL